MSEEQEAPAENPRPPISVVVPVRNDPGKLADCLAALERSEYPEFEVIVVDDASTDRTPEVAAGHGARTVRLERQSGPAAARNVGAEHARHPYLFFVDADVRVAPSTLRRAMEVFTEDPTVDALFGSYDRDPGARNLVSQYRNLLHHYVHQRSNEEAFTFWSGCGAIKRSVFLDAGGFDVGYGQASIEDIELGNRMRRSGHRIVLVKDLQVKHLKRWTLWGMVRCDVLHRGIPWTLLLLREGRLPDDLNLRRGHRLSTLLAGGLAAALLVGSWYYRSLLLVPLVTVIGLLAADRWAHERPIARGWWIAAGVTVAGTVVAMLVYTAVGHNLLELWALLAFAFLAAIVLLNLRFYLFFVELGRPLLVPVVIPLHVFFYLYSGLAFAAGLALHLGRSARRRIEPRLDEE